MEIAAANIVPSLDLLSQKLADLERLLKELEMNESTTNAIPIAQQSIYDFPEAIAARYMTRFLYPAMIIVGTFGNTATYCLMQRKAIGKSSAASYLKYLALVCTFDLWVGLSRHWVREIWGIDIRGTHYIVCKMHRFMLYVALDVTAWILVALTADRLIAVAFPYQANKYCTIEKTRRVTIFLFLFFAVFNFPVLVNFGRGTVLNKRTNETIVLECTKVDGPLSFYGEYVQTWLLMGFYVVGPFTFMLIANIVIAKRLYARVSYMENLTSNSSRKAEKIKESFRTVRTTTTLMFIICVEFLITATPTFVYEIAEPFIEKSLEGTPKEKAQLRLLYTIVRVLLFSNYTLHFFLYCLTARRFRREFCIMIGCRKKTSAELAADAAVDDKAAADESSSLIRRDAANPDENGDLHRNLTVELLDNHDQANGDAFGALARIELENR